MRFSTLLPVLPILTFTTARPRAVRSLDEFEERFIDSLPYTSNSTVRLVGYKKILVPPHEISDFESAWYDRPVEWNDRGVLSHASHFYYDSAEKLIRLYFPVEGALVSHDDQLIEADALGQLDVSKVNGNCHVVGRKKTAFVSGVTGNDIRGDIIYLAESAAPLRTVGSTMVYDFGHKGLHDHHHHKRDEEEEDGKKGCLENHNGENCSKAYGYNQGRCDMNPKTCMDYNGWITDCKKGTSHRWGIPTMSKATKFLGSDCSVAVAHGHCWNEVM